MILDFHGASADERGSRPPSRQSLLRLDQLAGEFDRNGVADAGRLAEGRFLGPLDQHHVDDPDDLAAFDIEHRAAAVAGVGCGIELVDVEAALT